MRRNNLGRVLIVVMRAVLQPSRTHLIHRPAKDALPAGGTLLGDPCHARSAIMFHLRVRPSPTWFRQGRRPHKVGAAKDDQRDPA